MEEDVRKEGRKIDKDDLDFLLEEWKTVVATQMHFNEMIMRLRTTGLSVVIAVYGAAAYSLKTNPGSIDVSGMKLSVAAAIILFGIILLICLFMIDFFYYHQMLRGAVEKGYELDAAVRPLSILGSQVFGLSSTISERLEPKLFGRFKTADAMVVLFYIIPITIGFIYLIAVQFCKYTAGS